MVNAINDQDFTFVEVTPGGADDPFTARNQTSLPAAVASPVQLAGGAVAVATVEGQQVAATPVVPSAAAQPAAPAQSVVAPVAQVPNAQLSPLEQAIKNGTLDEYIAGQVQAQTGKVMSGLQSSYDKRVAALEKERDDAREAIKTSQREAKLNSEDLTDEEKDFLREKWKLEDEREVLRQETEAADEYFKSLYAAGLAQEAAQFGVTVDNLMQFSEPEEMDNFVRDRELAFYKAGGTVTAVVPNGAAVAANSGVPAGATAQTDVGGQAPASPPKAAPTGTGVDAMKEHLSQLKWETVPFN